MEVRRQTSEDVIINAPMSFAGAAQRSWRLRRRSTATTWAGKLPITIVAILLIAVWWTAVVVWYLSFGLALIPYRILRRGARKRKAEALRHREMMAAIQKPEAPTTPALEP